MKPSSNYRWFIVSIFFVFMLLHQSDKLLIGPLTTQIMETFQITKAQMGAVSTGALIVGAIFYPIWGFLNDRFARSKLLALASLIWGSTTWLNAIAPLIVGIIADQMSLKSAFLIICISTWVLWLFSFCSPPGFFPRISRCFATKCRRAPILTVLLHLNYPKCL